MKRAILNDLLRKCRKDIPNHPQKDNFLHWSFLFQGNELISDGVNRHHEPPKHYGYHIETMRLKEGYRPKWHSELDAVKRCHRNMNGCTVVNIRLNKEGKPRMSLPCLPCRRLLYTVNVRKVIFTTEFGWGASCYEDYVCCFQRYGNW